MAGSEVPSHCNRHDHLYHHSHCQMAVEGGPVDLAPYILKDIQKLPLPVRHKEFLQITQIMTKFV